MAIKPSLIVSKNLRIIGSFSGQAKAYWKALDFLSRHGADIPFARMITNRYSLDDTNLALTRMKDMQDIKPVLVL